MSTIAMRFTFLLTLVCAACSGLPKSHGDSRIVARAPLRMLADDDPNNHYAVPIEVHGRRIMMLVDTGASIHLLDTAVADALGLEGSGSEKPVLDHAGEELAGRRLKPFKAKLGDGEIEMRETHVAPIGALGKNGFGGILSPQMALPGGMTIIDHLAGELLVIRAHDRDVEEMVRKRHPDFTTTSLPNLSRYRNIAIVEATVEGAPPLRALLDTGAPMTEVRAQSAGLDPRTEMQALGESASGTIVMGLTLSRAVWFGGTQFPARTVMVRPSMGTSDYQALLGMDVLSSMVIGIGLAPNRIVLGLPPDDVIRAREKRRAQILADRAERDAERLLQGLERALQNRERTMQMGLERGE